VAILLEMPMPSASAIVLTPAPIHQALVA
jgi:hypothetical protein